MIEELEVHKTINIEPTWQGILPILLEVVRNGSMEGYVEAKIELARMAKAADLWNAALEETKGLLNDES